MTEVVEFGVGRRSMTPEEQAAYDARQLASIEERRAARKAEFKDEAGRRIAALFAVETPDFSLVWKELNTAVAQMVSIWAVVEDLHAVVTGQKTVAQLTAYDALVDDINSAETLFTGSILAIRQAENTASAALDAAGTDARMSVDERIAEINAVAAPWPT